MIILSPSTSYLIDLDTDALARALAKVFAEEHNKSGYCSNAKDWNTDCFVIDGHFDLREIAKALEKKLAP